MKLIKVDNEGRVLIPNEYRKKYNILPNDILYLSTTDKGFKIRKNGNMSIDEKLFNKLKFIEQNYNFDISITIDNKTIYNKKSKMNEIKKDKICHKKIKINKKEEGTLNISYNSTDQKIVDLILISIT